MDVTIIIGLGIHELPRVDGVHPVEPRFGEAEATCRPT